MYCKSYQKLGVKKVNNELGKKHDGTAITLKNCTNMIDVGIFLTYILFHYFFTDWTNSSTKHTSCMKWQEEREVVDLLLG